MSFKSRVDSGNYFVFGFLAVFAVFLTCVCVMRFSINIFILTLLIDVFFAGFAAPLYLNTRYVLAEDGLYIHFGWFSKTFVPYSDMFAAESWYSRAMTFTLSSDRAGIMVRNKATGAQEVVTVAPLDKQGFLAELTRRSGIEVTVVKQAAGPRKPRTLEDRSKAVEQLYNKLKEEPEKFSTTKTRAPSSSDPQSKDK